MIIPKTKRISKELTYTVAYNWSQQYVGELKAPLRWWGPRNLRMFSDWAFGQGAQLVRDHGDYYLEFFDEKSAAFFMLKYI